MRKSYNIRSSIGKARHVVNFHDGEKNHPDGSPFFDIAIFPSVKNRNQFIMQLESEGYEENNWPDLRANRH